MTSHSRLPLPFEGDGYQSLAAITVRARDLDAAVFYQDGRSGALIHGRLQFVKADGASPIDVTAEELYRSWRQQGDAVLRSITGEYLIACWNADDRTALMAVDRFASLPLYWATNGDRFGFAATPESAARLAGRGLEIDWQAVYAYTYFHVIPAPMSIYRDVQRLDMGYALRIGNGRLELFRHWTPIFDERRSFDFSTERASFLSALRDGVAECTSGIPREKLGCFLSGGTDSSTIAGLVTKQYGAPAKTFAIGFDVAGFDETQYSRLAARHFGTEHTEYFVTADDVDHALEAVATQYEQPFGNSSALPTYLCAGIAREAGIQRMLGGDGGDELYGGNERYFKQMQFALWDKAPEFLRRRLLEPLLFGALGKIDQIHLTKARSYIEQARMPLPDRIQSRYNLLNHLGSQTIFTQDLLGQVESGMPLTLEQEVWIRARLAPGQDGAMSQINRLLAWDFKFTLADSDLPKVTRMCQAAGVDVSFPMLSHSLVEHSLRLDPAEKLKWRRLRPFFKEALRGFLPDEIIEKSKHGFGLPFGSWVLGHKKLQATAEDALNSLAARNIVNPEFMQQLQGRIRSSDAGFYGTMIWILMILELWLRASPLADVRVERN